MVSQDSQSDQWIQSIILGYPVVKLTGQTSDEWIRFDGVGRQGISIAAGEVLLQKDGEATRILGFIA